MQAPPTTTKFRLNNTMSIRTNQQLQELFNQNEVDRSRQNEQQQRFQRTDSVASVISRSSSSRGRVRGSQRAALNTRATWSPHSLDNRSNSGSFDNVMHWATVVLGANVSRSNHRRSNHIYLSGQGGGANRNTRQGRRAANQKLKKHYIYKCYKKNREKKYRVMYLRIIKKMLNALKQKYYEEFGVPTRNIQNETLSATTLETENQSNNNTMSLYSEEIVVEDNCRGLNGFHIARRHKAIVSSINLFDWFAPRRFGQGLQLSIGLVLFLLWVTALYMAAAYSYSQVKIDLQNDPTLTWQQYRNSVYAVYGPSELLKWAKNSDWREFDFDYLVAWGAIYPASMVGGADFYRWFTSIFIHTQFFHFVAVSLIIFFLGSVTEYIYGSIRTFVLIFITFLISNFFTVILVDPCSLTFGADAIASTLLGFYMINFAINRDRKKWFSVLRLVFGVIFALIYFISLIFLMDSSAFLNCVWGLFLGCILGGLFLQSLKIEVMEIVLPYISLGVVWFGLFLLPFFSYFTVIETAAC